MKYAVLFFILAVMLGLICWQQGAWWLLGLWPAANALVLSAAYASFGACVFGKSAKGQHALWARIFWLPYLLLTLAVWHSVRLDSTEDACNRVNADLVLGRRLLPGEYRPEFGQIVDLTSEFWEPKAVVANAPSYHSLPILDADVPAPEALEACLDAMKDQPVFIHCAQGHGRTGLVAVMLLISRQQASTVEAALEQLQARRPGISLNATQRRYCQGLFKRWTSEGRLDSAG